MGVGGLFLEDAMKLFRTRDIDPDEVDAVIAAKKIAAFDAVTRPRVGDFVRMSDGSLERISHDWRDRYQTTDGRFGASFYLSEGSASFSGGLNPAIPAALFEDTGLKRIGNFWFFHHDQAGAHRAVGVSFQCRVYRLKDEEEEKEDAA
jgi:hypothetical protein